MGRSQTFFQLLFARLDATAAGFWAPQVPSSTCKHHVEWLHLLAILLLVSAASGTACLSYSYLWNYKLSKHRNIGKWNETNWPNAKTKLKQVEIHLLPPEIENLNFSLPTQRLTSTSSVWLNQTTSYSLKIPGLIVSFMRWKRPLRCSAWRSVTPRTLFSRAWKRSVGCRTHIVLFSY